MTAVPVRHTVAAAQDLSDASGYYDTHAPEITAQFLDQAEATFNQIGRHPGLGKLNDVDIPNVRQQVIKGFPYAVFYIEAPDSILVLRVLHHNRNVGALLDVVSS